MLAINVIRALQRLALAKSLVQHAPAYDHDCILEVCRHQRRCRLSGAVCCHLRRWFLNMHTARWINMSSVLLAMDRHSTLSNRLHVASGQLRRALSRDPLPP